MSTPTVADMVAALRSCKCDASSGCAAAASEAEIVSAVAALEAERDALREKLRELRNVAFGAQCSEDKYRGPLRLCTVEAPTCALPCRC